MFFKPRNAKVKKAKENAKNMLRHADRVYCYRRHLMSDENVDTLVKLMDELKAAIQVDEVDCEKIDAIIRSLDKLMKANGGDIYPQGFIRENTEMILVAAILAIGFRSFFFQPFVIPTNSMYPTYNGMTPKVYSLTAKAPNLVERAFNFVVRGSSHYRLDALEDGEILVPLVSSVDPKPGFVNYKVVEGRKWFGLLPEQQREYTFYVNKSPVSVRVPFDFHDMDAIVHKTFFSQYADLRTDLAKMSVDGVIGFSKQGPVLRTNKKVKKGEAFLAFDIQSGDMLFVNRMVYHFSGPKLADAIVFRTRGIEKMNHPDGSPEEKYYIKRLVGFPGDQLSVTEAGVLMRNGSPITGVEAFQLNAQHVGLYKGYAQLWDMAEGKIVTVPEHTFYGMGDNSFNSWDSRAWGGAPEKDVIGRAAFIFYPFTDHWGLAK